MGSAREVLKPSAANNTNTGSYEWCIGVLVSPRHVLTAAHCVYDVSSTHKFVPALTFSAGLDGGISPFGEIPWTQVNPTTTLLKYSQICID